MVRQGKIEDRGGRMKNVMLGREWKGKDEKEMEESATGNCKRGFR